MATRPTPRLAGRTLPWLELIDERLGLRLNAQQTADLDATIRAVLAGASERLTPEELYAAFRRRERADLFADFAARLTIGETHFFRVTPQIAALREVVLPDLIARRAHRCVLECWSAGCSSGEEPYTLAILLRELFEQAGGWQARILATDLSLPALEAARRACYRDWSFRETPPEVRGRYFERRGESWCLNETIRRMVRFAPLNLVASPYPAPTPAVPALDLILCRNVTIYFRAPVTERVYRRFAAALAPDGWLILGPSDPPPPDDCFEPMYLPKAVLWRKRAATSSASLATSLAPAPPARTADAAGSAVPFSSPPREAAPAYSAPIPSVSPVPYRPAAPVVPAAAPVETVEAQVAAARALAQGGAREEARARLLAVVRAAPLAVSAHRLLGFLALEDGRHADALESLRRATFLAPDDPLAQFGLGRTYRAFGDAGRARAAFRQVRRLLATWPADRPIPGDEGLVAAELIGAAESQLAESAGEGTGWA